MQNQSWHRRAKISHVSVLTFEASGCRGGRKSGQRARSSDRLCQSTTRGLGCLLLPKREATLWRSWQDDYTDCRRRHLELEWYISISWYDPITVTLVSAFQCTDYIIDNEAFSLTSVSAQKKKKNLSTCPVIITWISNVGFFRCVRNLLKSTSQMLVLDHKIP